LAAIVDPGYRNRAGWIQVEKHAPLSNAEPELAIPALKLLNVSMSGPGESLQGGDHTFPRGAVESVEIAKRRWQELNHSHYKP
jgi:hypothetical protein